MRRKYKRKPLRQNREGAILPFGADNLKLDMVQFQIISLCCGRKNTKAAIYPFAELTVTSNFVLFTNIKKAGERHPAEREREAF